MAKSKYKSKKIKKANDPKGLLNINLVKKCYLDYQLKRPHYRDIDRYYYGNTDSLKDFKPILGRSNNKIKTNFVGKLVDEEAEYSFSNPITYSSQNNNDDAVTDVINNFKNNLESHDLELGTELVKFGLAFEINYYTYNLQFKNKIVSPLDGYAYIVNNVVKLFLYVYSLPLDTKKYIDVYTDKYIYHLDENFNHIKEPTPHFFGIVPVGVGMVDNKQYSYNDGYIKGDKTIYRTIKTIQDAFEINFSDISSEISDFRNAILLLFGADEKEPERDENGNIIRRPPIIRSNSILEFESKEDQDARWLIKNINDTFIKNTRDDMKNLIYTLTSHIDSNEKMSSNLSGIALRSRLQSLEGKCGKNELAFKNIIVTRLICLFRFLYLLYDKKYNFKDINIKFTPKVPVDEAMLGDLISKIPQDVVSNETKRGWLPRVDNVVSEGEKIKNEKKDALSLIGDL